MPKSAKRQFLVRVNGIDGYWVTRTGGNKNVPTTKTFDGGSTIADVLTGNPDVTDVTVGRVYDRDRDGAQLNRWLRLAGHWNTTIDETDADEDLVPAGHSRTYTGRLKEVHPPEVDARSGDEAMVELVFVIQDVA